jgi:hypothetical protein
MRYFALARSSGQASTHRATSVGSMPDARGHLASVRLVSFASDHHRSGWNQGAARDTRTSRHQVSISSMGICDSRRLRHVPIWLSNSQHDNLRAERLKCTNTMCSQSGRGWSATGTVSVISNQWTLRTRGKFPNRKCGERP